MDNGLLVRGHEPHQRRTTSLAVILGGSHKKWILSTFGDTSGHALKVRGSTVKRAAVVRPKTECLSGDIGIYVTSISLVEKFRHQV